MAQEKKMRIYTFEKNSQIKSNNQKIVAIAITVTTPYDVPYAGTDANVRLIIGGQRFEMDQPGYDDFERGETDTYYFKTNMTLGSLRKAYIELSHDNSGKNPGWYVSNVILQIFFPNQSVAVTYKTWGTIGWLAKDSAPYYTTAVELQNGEEV